MTHREADLEGLFQWGSGGPEHDWAIGGLSSLPGAPFARSSFELLERLLDLALSRMPDLQEIIFAGQSAGGQLVQRYAALNDYEFPSGVRVRYVPANPYAVLYVDGQRPNVNAPGFSTPTFASWPGDEVCADLGNSCNDYDDYPLGLQAIPPSADRPGPRRSARPTSPSETWTETAKRSWRSRATRSRALAGTSTATRPAAGS